MLSAYLWSCGRLAHLPDEETKAQRDEGLIQHPQHDRAAKAGAKILIQLPAVPGLLHIAWLGGISLEP